MENQTFNTLHNAIMEAGSKDRPPMLAPGNYIQLKSKIKRYIDTKPNHELIYYCLENPPYELGIDNDIYSTVNACSNACEIWKAIERLKQEWKRFVTLVKQSQELKTVSYHKLNRGKAIVNSPQPIYDQEPSMVDDDETSKDKEIDKLMALISLSFKKIYKPTNNNLRTSSNTSRVNQDNSIRINKNTGYESQRIGNVAGARETIGSSMVQKSGIQCYNCKEFGHVARECHKPKRAKDAAYHREKILLSAVDSGPIFDTEPEQKVQNDDHYDVFAFECQHPEQSESVHKTYLIEQNANNMIIESVDMNYDSEQIDQNDEDTDLAKERELLASLIKKLKCEIDERKNHNKFLETSNKVLIDKLKSEIKDFKNKNNSLELSNNQFKEANNKLFEENDLLYADLKKSQAELKRRDSIEYASEMELECAKEDKELEKVIELENKVKVLDNIVYKTGQSVQTMNMLNNKCRTRFAKPQYLKKAKQANPRLEYYYADHMHAILGVYTELDEVTNLQCDYLELLQKCECLETELSKSKMMSKSFESDLKAQLQDKGIVINELKKLIKMIKGISMDTKFEKSLVIRQPNAFKSLRSSVLGKPTTFSNYFVRKDFSKSTSVTQTHMSNDFSKPVTAQTLPTNQKSILKNTNVLAPGMYKLYTDHTQTRTSQLPQDSRKTNKHVLFSTGVIPTTSVSRPQLKSNPQGDRVMHNNSQGKKQEVEDPRRSVKLSKNKMSVTACNDNLNAKTLNVKSVFAMRDKCVLHDKHDMCVLKSVAKTLKRTVASESNKKPRNFTRKLYERVSKTCSWWYPKFTPSGYIWKPKSRK
nr:hypothetical protein [Tanacetum cinerariifolium]